MAGMGFDSVLLIVAALLGISVLASKISGRAGVPVLVVFVGIGMLAGPNGLGGIHFADAAFAQQVATLALICIVFSGGMDTEWKHVRPHWAQALSLSVVGVASTALIVGFFAHKLLGFGLLEAMLLGAIISSTDAAAVFMSLRGRTWGLREDLRGMLEFESGTNDSMALFLTVTLVGLATSPVEGSGWSMAGSFAVQMTVGAVMGYAIGRCGVVAMRQLRLDVDALYHVASVVVMLTAYAATVHVSGNGMLAVYVAGLVYGNGEYRQKVDLRRFHEGLAWLMQVAMFLILGLLVVPSQLPAVAGAGLVLALALMLVARPVGVALALLPFRMGRRERAMVSWTGLRGAVPIVLATFPLLAGLDQAQTLFHLVFFVVLLSAFVQGPSLPWLANRLDLVEKPKLEIVEGGRAGLRVA